MDRLLLEICPEQTGNGAAPELPPILICARNGQEALLADAFAGVDRPLILRIGEGGYALEQPRASGIANLNVGEWHAAEGWKLRVTPAAGGSDAGQSMVADNPSWAAPELRVTTYDGDRVKRLRCMLPTDEGAQLVIGRGGGQADLIVEDDHVSRTHLRFFVKDGKQYAEDMNSRWGSKLNGQPLTDPQALQHGDEILIGKSTINYLCYWDILPASDASMGAGGRSRGADELQVKSDDANVRDSIGAAASAAKAPAAKSLAAAPAKSQATPPTPPAAKTPDPAKPATPPPPAKPDPAKPEAAKPEPAKPTPPPKPPEKKPATKQSKSGLDIGWAIVIVLLLLAGIAYLAWLVFKH